MPKYVIERDIPGLGDWSPQRHKVAAQTSCDVLSELGPRIEWLQSYVTGNKMYCIYNAANEELVREHARISGLPLDSMWEVKTIIGPFTAENQPEAKAIFR